MERVAIVGLGLIGTSIGLGLRRWDSAENKRGPRLRITGFDLDIAQQQQARRMRAVDETTWDLPSVVKDADLVIVATPVRAVREVFETIAPNLAHGSVVTDTCSTKAQVMQWAREVLPTTTDFVGGHPMAGKTGSTEAADAGLFHGATWCVVPSTRSAESSIQLVLGLAAALEADAQFIDATEHDAFVGGVSHLPFLASTALMRTVSSGPAWRDMKTLTAGGFRDVSRLAAGSAVMYRDICLTNRESLKRWLAEYTGALLEISTLLDTDETGEALERLFNQARDARAEWSTAARSDGELLQSTEDELSKSSLSGQFGQMLLGGLARRKRPSASTNGAAARPERE